MPGAIEIRALGTPNGTSGKPGRDALLAIAGEAVYVVTTYTVTLLLARAAGPRALGIYAISLLVLKTGGICCSAGLKQAGLRYIPIYLSSDQGRLVRGMIRFSSRVCALLAIAAGMALFGSLSIPTGRSFDEAALATGLRLIALVLPLIALQELWSQALQALRAIEYKILVEKFLEPGVRLVAVAVFLLCGVRLLGGVLALVTGALVSVVAAFYFMRARMVSLSEAPECAYEPRIWLGYSLPLMLQSLVVFAQPGIPILLIGYFGGPSEVGIFSATLRVALLVSLPVIALNTAFAPQISEVSAAGDISRLRELYRTMTGWTIFLSIPILLIILFFADPILRVFGRDFHAGLSSLRLLALGYFIVAGTGSAGCLLVMTGRVGMSLANALVGVGLNGLLTLALIPGNGIVGAAVAAVVTLACIGILSVVEVSCLLGLQPYGSGAAKALVSGAIAAAVLLPGSPQEWTAVQVPLFGAAYLFVFWLLNSTRERAGIRRAATALMRATSVLLRAGEAHGIDTTRHASS